MKNNPDERTLRVQMILPMDKSKQTYFDKRKGVKKRRILKFDKVRPFMVGQVVAHKSCFDSVSKLADIIYNHWGTGEFNILFHGKGKNKKFRKHFKCLVQKGQYCEFKGRKCHKWRWHKSGNSCKKNSTITYNYFKRGCITITERMSLERPYSYKWHKSSDKMNLMRIGFRRD